MTPWEVLHRPDWMLGRDPRLGETGPLITASVMLEARILVTHHRSVKNYSWTIYWPSKRYSICTYYWDANASLVDFRYLFQQFSLWGLLWGALTI